MVRKIFGVFVVIVIVALVLLYARNHSSKISSFSTQTSTIANSNFSKGTTIIAASTTITAGNASLKKSSTSDITTIIPGNTNQKGSSASSSSTTISGGTHGSSQSTTSIYSTVVPTTTIQATYDSVGYRKMNLTEPNGTQKTIWVWYPTLNQQGSLNALANATPAPGTYPVILFSHGYLGCGTQSLFITEGLALRGYVVIAINHYDAACNTSNYDSITFPGFAFPWTWGPAKYADRISDMELLLNSFPAIEKGANFTSSAFNYNEIGVMGHSLGGYTALSISGAWPTDRDPRIKATLVFSPYSSPFLTNGSLQNMTVPVMIQGGTQDGITKYLYKIYDQLPGPKYYLILNNATHFVWTNEVCGNYTSVIQCGNSEYNANLIVSYSAAFFNRYLKGQQYGILNVTNPNLSSYEYNNS